MRVGTSPFHLVFVFIMEDHPHACGDKVHCICDAVIAQGSSPCVWGQDRFFTDLSDSLRIIPMRVGTSPRLHHGQCALQDHPHACGDKLQVKCHASYRQGSSPCVWGQACVLVDKDFFQRIIPMRVGTSRMLSVAFFQVRDHPHACGDKK